MLRRANKRGGGRKPSRCSKKVRLAGAGIATAYWPIGAARATKFFENTERTVEEDQFQVGARHTPPIERN